MFLYSIQKTLAHLAGRKHEPQIASFQEAGIGLVALCTNADRPEMIDLPPRDIN